MNDDFARRTVSTLLTLDEAAAVLRTPVATLRYWRHLGIGPAGFRLGRRVMYRRDDLDEWVTAQRDAQACERADRRLPR